LTDLIPVDEQVEAVVTDLKAIQVEYRKMDTELRMRYYHAMGIVINRFIEYYSGERTVTDVLHTCAVNMGFRSDHNLWDAKRFALEEPDIESAVIKYRNWTEVKTRVLKIEQDTQDRAKCPTCGRVMPKGEK